ncbi:MAG TPA: MBL fold metallo-hydrolase, partial [Solirubrobacterales bacterium]|nr:MBL fold metallo-hydrolase [Solirubrobacterales bacterium]
PLEPLNGLDALLLAYVAQVASWCAAPDWAELRIDLGAAGLVVAYLVLGLGALFCTRLARLRRVARARARGTNPRPFSTRSVTRANAVLAATVAAALALAVLWSGGGRSDAAPLRGRRVEVLDVGQGDAILFRPAEAPAILVDGGPPEEGLARRLAELEVDRLGAAVVTHEQADHAGGIEDLLGVVPIERLVFARLSHRLVSEAAAAGARPQRVAAGRELRSGRLHLRVLWPPPESLREAPPGTDPNQLSLVMEARWGDFTMLLTGDAEAESVPIEPSPVDVLKVAHHGSVDAGLAALLDRARPRIAVISVGEGNPYGHPAPGTIATLARHGVSTLRTDRDGDVVIDVSRHSFTLDG